MRLRAFTLLVFFCCSTFAFAEYPTWDKKIGRGRFVVLSPFNNEAVLDKETGLVWERSPGEEELIWIGANSRCIQLSKGDRFAWRLPTIQELSSLLDPTQAEPALPSGHPFQNVQFGAPDFYWSATFTSTLPVGNFAWGLSFGPGRVDGIFTRSALTIGLFSWCVRGGQGSEVQ